MRSLFEEERNKKNFQPIGKGMLVRKTNSLVEVWRKDEFLFKRELDPREKSPEIRELVVQLSMVYNAHKTKLADVFGISSRQTIDNRINSFKSMGV